MKPAMAIIAHVGRLWYLPGFLRVVTVDLGKLEVADLLFILSGGPRFQSKRAFLLFAYDIVHINPILL